jgi:hypothetical protein
MTLYGNWGRQHFRPEQNIFLIEEHPLKEGPIIMRILLPAGYIIPAHFHPGAERSTVIFRYLQLLPPPAGDNVHSAYLINLQTETSHSIGSFNGGKTFYSR